MSLGNVKRSLGAITKSLDSVHESREYLIRNTREVVILCSQSIICVHKGDMPGAASKAKKARAMLAVHRKKASGNLKKHIAVPEQELVEALSLIAIASKRPVPSASSLGVSAEAYVLGLLDCIGELKRLVLDRIRAGESSEARKIFIVMEELYRLLYPLAAHDKLVRDARKKLDVNRKLVEDARAAVAEECRRADLINAVGRLEERLGKMNAGDGI